jgi:hypothetical protein
MDRARLTIFSGIHSAGSSILSALGPGSQLAGRQNRLNGQRGRFSRIENIDHKIENIDHKMVREVFDPPNHALPDIQGLTEEFVFERQVEFFKVAGLEAVGLRIGDHLRPQVFSDPLAFNFYKIALLIEQGVAVVIDLQSSGNHLQGGGHVGLGGPGIVGNLLEAFRAVAGGAVLGAGYVVFGERSMNLPGQIDLNTLCAGLDSMSSAVVQGDPVREDVIGIQPLNEKKGFRYSG